MSCSFVIPTPCVLELFPFRNIATIIIIPKEQRYFWKSASWIIRWFHNQTKGPTIKEKCSNWMCIFISYSFVAKHKCLIYGLWFMLMLIKIAFPFCLIEVNELCNCIQFNVAFCLSCGYKNVLFLESLLQLTCITHLKFYRLECSWSLYLFKMNRSLNYWHCQKGLNHFKVGLHDSSYFNHDHDFCFFWLIQHNHLRYWLSGYLSWRSFFFLFFYWHFC